MKDAKDITSIPELAGLVSDVSVTIEKEQKALLAQVEDLQNGQKTIDNWLKELEAKVDQANKGGHAQYGVAETNLIKSAIPDRHRRCVDLWARYVGDGDKAVKMTAMESWLKNSIMLCNPTVAARKGVQLLEEMDRIEKAFGFDPTQKAAMQEGTDSEGGYMVPVPLEATVLREIEDSAIMRALCRVFPMSVKTVNFPNLATNVTVGIIAEEGTITQSEPTVGQRALTAFKFAVRAICSMELVQDSAIGVLGLLVSLMTEKYGLKEDQQILEGTGSSEITGVVAAASVNEVTNGANGALWNPAKALEQKWKSRKRYARRGSVWIAAPEIVKQIEAYRIDAVSAADGAGDWLYKFNEGRAEINGTGLIPTGYLHGFPIIDHSEISITRTVGGSGAVCSNMYFGPWSQAVMIGDLLGLQFGVSEHTQWATGQLDLRMIKRTAGLVAIPEAMVKQTGMKTA